MVPSAVFVVLVLAGFPKTNAAVSNEDIRSAILQIVNVVRATDDKLERHEFRDRVVGEQLKKGMINIDKRIRMLDPLKGTASRLDDRLAAVETILMQKNEREKMQLQRTYEAVLDIQRNLPLVMEQLKNDIIDKIQINEPPAQILEPVMSKKDFEKVEKAVMEKMDKVTSTINKMEGELAKIREDNKNLNAINDKSSENLDKVKRHLDTSEQLLAKFESKLAEYNKVPEPPKPDKEHEEWKQNFLKALDAQKFQVKEVLSDMKNVKDKLTELPKKSDLGLIQNTTLEKLEEIKQETIKQPNLTSQLLTDTLEDINNNVNTTHEETIRNINVLSDIAANLAESFAANYGKIKEEMQALGRVDQVMIKTADNVLDTKRRFEYGVHQILAEVTKQIKESTKDINQAISDRFDNFEMSMLDEETGALANATSKLEEDIHQVWRQIGIMYQQMTASTDTLNRLQNQTNTYVNGSLNVMDNMKGKVGQITGMMSDVESNLNYLLGKLSLVTKEFNQIKTGLGKALDQIRDSFHTVQDKMKDAGPGPHRISSNEVDPNPK
ncbi:uncharacterized protein [Leptinotarsa decemlineata]|uniref:uncharacterized protein n=1 Tax=Leptinotarsa decemlineata TaxID=7539 RepID=UPI003D30C1F3